MKSSLRQFIKAIASVLGILFNVVDGIKGRKTTYEMTTNRNTLARLTGHSVQGYEINIYCRMKHYKRIYDRWFVPDEDHISYHVYSTVTNDASEALKEACALDIDFPALLPKYASEDAQRKAAIDAYLDLLIKRLTAAKDVDLKPPPF